MVLLHGSQFSGLSLGISGKLETENESGALEIGALDSERQFTKQKLHQDGPEGYLVAGRAYLKAYQEIQWAITKSGQLKLREPSTSFLTSNS